MKKLVVGLMVSVSMFLTACGEFQSINKSSNEVLEALSPYLSETDQKLAQELSESYDKDIVIRENLMDNKTIEIEIEGNVAQLEIVNQGDVAFRLNGRKIYFDELENNAQLEAIISSSLVKVSSNFMSLIEPEKSQAFLGGLLTSVFSMVVKGIFNYAMVKVKDKFGEEIGNSVGTIGNSIVGGVTGEPKPSKEEVKGAKDSILGTIFNTVINTIAGGTKNQSTSNVNNIGQILNPGSSSSNSNNNVSQPQQNCNLFCNLFGLLMNNIIK